MSSACERLLELGTIGTIWLVASVLLGLVWGGWTVKRSAAGEEMRAGNWFAVGCAGLVGVGGFYWVASDLGDRCDNFFAFALLLTMPSIIVALVSSVAMVLIAKVLALKNGPRDE